MADKKLTDEEIIKRLERCVKRGNRNYDTDIVLDFINRQKSEIERLQKEVNLVSIQFQDLQERYEEAQAEIERLESANDEKFRQWDMLAEKSKQHYADLYEEAKDILKAEAYKECLTKVKNYIKTHCNPYSKPDFDYGTSIKILNFINNLLKEMVGEEE